MFLTKEQYYKRRWFLAILFLLSGFCLLYLSYGLFYYNKDKSELTTKNTLPTVIKIEKTKIGDTPLDFLTIINNNEKFSASINDSILKQLSILYNLPDLNSFSFGNELVFEKGNKSYKYSYSDDRLYELEINGIKIITYQKKKPYMAYLILIIALAWISFQVSVLYRLKTKGIKVYDDYKS
ncbi:hypothetical protein BZARG_2545 [Bizionia argentinensis JUB59]|uniref:Uncharacterized protein n=1 Tax=Bizionia argentinensis JUB59 TaxID=1046627 RepID=G2EGS8_9FLAO|nr:hypothetical protein [Bizionia argentinensis]EGV42354.2 hypothetical protein BZARG_2545 [Bizionia argentinensis JUB59]